MARERSSIAGYPKPNTIQYFQGGDHKQAYLWGLMMVKGEPVSFKAFGETADHLQKAIKEENYKKFSLFGDYRPNDRDAKKTDFHANKFAKHKLYTLEAIIVKSEPKQANNGALYTEVIMKEGNLHSGILYSMALFQDYEQHGVDLSKNSKIAINGELAVFTGSDGKETYRIKPFEVAREKSQLKNLEPGPKKEKNPAQGRDPGL